MVIKVNKPIKVPGQLPEAQAEHGHYNFIILQREKLSNLLVFSCQTSYGQVVCSKAFIELLNVFLAQFICKIYVYVDVLCSTVFVYVDVLCSTCLHTKLAVSVKMKN